MPVTLRVLIVSGSEDPVGDYGEGPKKVYEQLQNITLKDIVDFQKQNVKGLHYRSVFAGDPKGLSNEELQRLGNVKTLTAHEVFGY